jgi:hypothetical protein
MPISGHQPEERGGIMRRTRRNHGPIRPQGRSGKMSVSPYCIEEIGFTLQEIRRARNAA